jgi:ankyrin repeat protein
MAMPEFVEDENIRRAGALIGHPGPNAWFECFGMAVYFISNNMYDSFADKNWEIIITMLRRPGLMDHLRRLATSESAAHETTISAFLEKLFQALIYRAQFCSSDPDELYVIEWLLRCGQSPDSLVRLERRPYTGTAVAASIYGGRVDLLRLLLEHGADVNHGSAQGVRPLELALCFPEESYYRNVINATSTRIELARLLLRKGADVGFPPSLGQEPVLNLAIGLGGLGIVKMIIDRGARIRDGVEDIKGSLVYRITPLNKAASFNLGADYYRPEGIVAEKALTLVKYIADLLIQRFPSCYQNEITADTFIAAAEAGHCNVISYLASLLTPFDLDFENELGITPLHAAAERGCIETCRLLVQLGCPLNSQATYIFSPLHVACAHGSDEVVDFLILGKTDLDVFVDLDTDSWIRHRLDRAQDDPAVPVDQEKVQRLLPRSMTPLQMAILFQNDKAAHSLLQHHAKIFGGELVLMAEHGTLDIGLLSALLDAGADPNERSDDGKSVLQLLSLRARVCKSLHLDDDTDWEHIMGPMVELLLQREVEIECADIACVFRLGMTHLNLLLFRYMEAHSTGSPDIKSKLLEKAMLARDLKLIDKAWNHYNLPYRPSILCAAVAGRLPYWVGRLVACRSNNGVVDVYEATAIGMAAYLMQEDMDLLRFLCDSFPPSGTCYMPIRYERSLWRLDPIHVRFEKFPSRWDDSVVVMVSPLTYPALSHNQDAFSYLLDRGYKPNWTTWLAIAQENQTSMALALKNRGFRFGEVSSDCTFDFQVPIRERLFLAKGHNPYPVWAGKPLHHAISNKNAEMVRVLCEVGLLIEDGVSNHHDISHGRTPLQLAIEVVASDAILHALLDSGADINAPSARRHGATALQMAAIKGLIGIAKMLIERGARVNAPRSPHHGRTALEGAAEHGHLDMIELLLQSGVETTGLGRRQFVRSVKFAEENGHGTAARQLRRHRAWTDEDEQLLRSPDLLDEEKCWPDENHYPDDELESEQRGEEDDEEEPDDSEGCDDQFSSLCGNSNCDDDNDYDEGHDNGGEGEPAVDMTHASSEQMDPTWMWWAPEDDGNDESGWLGDMGVTNMF